MHEYCKANAKKIKLYEINKGIGCIKIFVTTIKKGKLQNKNCHSSKILVKR